MLPGRQVCIMGPLRRHFSQQITQHIARDIVSIKVSEPKELGRNGQALPIHADKLGKNGFVCGHFAGIALVSQQLCLHGSTSAETSLLRIPQHRDEPNRALEGQRI